MDNLYQIIFPRELYIHAEDQFDAFNTVIDRIKADLEPTKIVLLKKGTSRQTKITSKRFK